MTRQDLDRISTEHPILFTRICEHTVTVNTMALKLLGIDDHTPNPAGGEIVKDEQGKAVGILRETARYLAYEMQPLKSVDEIKELLTAAMDMVSAWGITSVQSDDFETFSAKDWRKVITAYQELKAEGMKKQEILGYLQPIFIQADMHCAEERLGKDRLLPAYKFKKMRDMGIRTSFSSDAPIETPNPMDGIYVASTRMDYNQYPQGGWDPSERMEVEDITKIPPEHKKSRLL